PARGGAGGRRRRWRSSVTSPDPVTEALRLVSAHLPAEAPDPPVLTGLADGAGQRAGSGDLQQADRARQEQEGQHAADLAAHDAHSQSGAHPAWSPWWSHEHAARPSRIASDLRHSVSWSIIRASSWTAANIIEQPPTPPHWSRSGWIGSCSSSSACQLDTSRSNSLP